MWHKTMIWDLQCIPHKTKVYVNVKNNMLSVLPGREKKCGEIFEMRLS